MPAAPAVTPPKSDAILDAALDLFEERTYAGTAVPLVAERAGVAVGTIYRSFAGKEALANAVFRRAKRDFLDEVSRDLASGATMSVRDQVLAMWRGMARFAAHQPRALAFLEHQQHASYLDDESHILSAEVEAAALDVISAGQASGSIRPGEPTLLLALVFGAFIGMTKLARAEARDLSTAEVEASAGAVWDLLRPPTPDLEDLS